MTMTWTRGLAIMLPAAALAACQQAERDATKRSPEAATNVAAAVIALTPQQRDVTFFRAVRDADIDCQKITASERLADTGGKPTWRVQCDRRSWNLIEISSDGTALVVSRTGS